MNPKQKPNQCMKYKIISFFLDETNVSNNNLQITVCCVKLKIIQAAIVLIPISSWMKWPYKLNTVNKLQPNSGLK